jgi:nicotinamidase-related amidase
MEQIYGLTIPQTLAEVCTPARLALLVYDMQVGVLRQLPPETVARTKANVAQALAAARASGIRVFFSRHLSLPKEAMGVFQLRQAMAWQHVASVEQVHPWFLRDAPGFAIDPDLTPRPSEVVFDKITMSAFEGTFLNIALRDCGLQAFAIVGVALEVGIEPTVRHGADMGYIPIVVTDACGGRDEAAQQRALEGIQFAGDALLTDTASFCACLRTGRSGGPGA